jgi:membrane-bound serine protease (ClpP class)
MKKVIKLILVALLLQGGINASNDSINKIYIFPIMEEIAPPVEKTVKDALEEAAEKEVDLILVRMDTYGGMVNVADNIRTLFLNSKTPVWVYIENNAASAGAFIAIACHKIFMQPGATIGAATVVDGATGAKVDEKYQSFMRGKMRETAEARGRNPRIAEAMVDGSVFVEGVTDSGKVVTLTVSEAVEHGFCDGVYASLDELLEAHGLDQATIYKYEESSLDKVIRFFLRPAVSGILITVMVIGLFVELRTPGLGFPGLAALIAMTLYFVPAYLEGLVANWELLLLFSGLVLIALEIFVIPGFGVAGILGAIFLFSGLVLALVKNSPEGGWSFEFPDAEPLLRASLTVGLSLLTGTVVMLLTGKPLVNSRFFKRVSVDTQMNRATGYVGIVKPPVDLIGQTGTAVSHLRPTGTVRVGNERYEARSRAGLISTGETVKIVGISDFTLLVESQA